MKIAASASLTTKDLARFSTEPTAKPEAKDLAFALAFAVVLGFAVVLARKTKATSTTNARSFACGSG
jgi:hypothetical protein